MMKKLFLVGALALFGAVNAQKFEFGVKSGYSLSSLKTKGEEIPKYDDLKSSFYVGGLAEYKVNNKVGVQAELLYSETGGKLEVTESSGLSGVTYTSKYKSHVKLGNLMLPIGVKYYPIENLSFSAGFNFAFILSAKNKESVEISDSTSNYSNTVDFKDNVKTLNLAPFIGAEYKLYKGLFFDARYNLGITNLVKNAEGSLKNSFFQVGVGYKF